jgi:hypothetical protein
MVGERRRDRHHVVLHHHAPFRELVDLDQRRQRDAPFVRAARLDVKGVHLEEEPGHPLERRGTPGVDARAQPGSPGEPDQVAVVGVVVRVVVGQEHVAQPVEGDTGQDELARDAVAAVDHVGRVVDQDDLGSRGARSAGARPAPRAQQDQASPRGGGSGAPAQSGRRRRRGVQEGAPATVHGCPPSLLRTAGAFFRSAICPAW